MGPEDQELPQMFTRFIKDGTPLSGEAIEANGASLPGIERADPPAGYHVPSAQEQAVYKQYGDQLAAKNSSEYDFGATLVTVFAAAITGGAASGALGAGVGIAEEAAMLGISDLAAGGIAGGAAGGGSWISQLIDSGVNAISGSSSGGGFDLGSMFNNFTESVKSFFTPAAESGSVVADAAQGVASAAETIGETATSTPSIATQAADAAGASTDASKFIETNGFDSSSFQGTPQTTVTPPSGSVAQTASGSKGLVQSVLDWGKQNQGIASGLITAAGGLMKGVGENAALEKKLAAEKEIAAMRSPQATQDALRAQAASSGAFGQTLGFSAPGTPPVLRRPDGSLVYARPGIVAGQMK